MRYSFDRRRLLRPIQPEKPDLAGWIAAVLGVLFTLGIMLWPGGWSQPTRLASNTTTVEKSSLTQPPAKQP
jgi:hypothetical protein